MDIAIDADSEVPIYLQIVQQVRHLVAVGQMKAGEQLPTVRELAAELRVNPNTVARAYDQLDKDKVISTQQGRGTYVRERPDQDHLSRVRQEQLYTILDTAVTKALSMGYSDSEITSAFEIALQRWIQEQQGMSAKQISRQEQPGANSMQDKEPTK